MELHDNKFPGALNGGFAGPNYPGAHAPQGYSPYPPGTFQGPPVQPAYGLQGPQGVPIATQPGVPGNAWMPAPVVPQNCPPGLEYLTQIDQILIHQQVELLEVLTGFETNNKYEIKNALGQRVFFAAEENDCCTRTFCGPARSFVMTIIDNMGREVIRLHRPFRCSSCFCPCCLQEVKSLDECQAVGRISKQWSGFVKEAFTDADNFGIQFPMDLDVKIKAVLLGACFLIDFMFFEQQKNND
ncbi:phospholipid scramblase 1-like isoform X3 [Ambystoma mexicanum]|uniref:phospholipid scramblase 1-like isoform X3 n=1 Tax=Ambystoma mexicanum TaxID=8296 RepID=UPI0037E86958